MRSSYDLLRGLKKMGYLKEERDPLWWPRSGTFEVVVGAILTQQTKWEKVERSLENLRAYNLLTLEAVAQTDPRELAVLIKPSGFYNTKAKRLQQLCRNIYERFGDFETFAAEVERSWLLAQKGVGEESADSILCYACRREIFVMD
ncbi:MAG: 3-methyladenine DNA glycosylase, partial [Campylobacteraceae bacterium 4484_4]